MNSLLFTLCALLPQALLADVAAGPIIVMGVGMILVIAALIVLLIIGTIWLIRHFFKKNR